MSERFTIRYDVPIPKKGRLPKYPWDRLKPGGSFSIKDATRHTQQNILRAAKDLGFKVVTRWEGPHLRVWRKE